MSTALSRPVSGAPGLVLVMGVSGSGKTSVGEALAARLGARFLEGDALHPRANVAKMAAGIPLEDADRWPWLDRIGAAIADAAARGTRLVVTCSALKKAYRDRLRKAAGQELAFVFLHGTEALLRERMKIRKGHFMPVTLLDSQLATLEDPRSEGSVVAVDIDAELDEVIEIASRGLKLIRPE